MLFSILIALQILTSSCKPDADYYLLPGYQSYESLIMNDNLTEDMFMSEITTENVIMKDNQTKDMIMNEITTAGTVESTTIIKNEPTTKSVAVKDHVYWTPRKKHHHSRSRWSYLRTVAPTTSVATTTGIAILNKTTTPGLKPKFTCPEEEKASNIGPYEVPTKRDLVLLTIKTLHRQFSRYQRKTMTFLDDINQVVIATEDVEKHCMGVKTTYRKCVKHVRIKCETITKALMASLEQQRQDVIAFGNVANTICSIEEMRQDPVKLIKILASEEASLEFALPGFLRLLHTCSNYCISPISDDKFKAVKPSRHLTDTDVVIRHFLTKKNYKRLLKPVIARGAYKIPILDKSKPKL